MQKTQMKFLIPTCGPLQLSLTQVLAKSKVSTLKDTQRGRKILKEKERKIKGRKKGRKTGIIKRKRERKYPYSKICLAVRNFSMNDKIQIAFRECSQGEPKDGEKQQIMHI